MDSTNGFSKANGNKDQEFIIKKRNVWQRRSKMEKILLAVTGILLLLVIILFVLSMIQSHSDTEYCTTPACVTIAANIINFMDPSVDPCEDFYQYACGGWIKANPLSENERDWDRYEELTKTNNHILKYILENENFTLMGEAEKKARTFYKSCMNQTRIEERGAEPLLDVLKKAGGWTISGDFDIQDWNFQRMLEVQHNQYGGTAFFSWSVAPDLKNSTRNIIAIYEPYLTLHTRDYYLNETKDDKILDACLSYMSKVGVLLGGEENATRDLMKDVLDFEKKLAEIILPDEEKMDHNKIYEKMTIADLQELMPFIHWTHYFNSAFNSVGRKVSSSEDVVVYAKEYFEKLTKLVSKYLYNPQGRVTLINYAAWTVIRGRTQYSSKPFRDANDVLNEAMFGSKDKDVRWETCVSTVDGGITFAVSAMFIRETFKVESKAMAESMVDKIKQAFKDNFHYFEWMDPETQKRAAEKVDSLQEMIGFPDYILYPDQVDEEYKDLQFSETDYFNNTMNVLQYDSRREMKKLDLPTNRSEWMMSATDTNAYYSSSLNHIVITAAYLQPPFYDLYYPKSINFGAMGSIMGHEITHAFDDSGRLYDKHGNLNQWWKNSTIQNFEKRSQCFIDQYSSFEVAGTKLNGKTTLGENLADCGGLKVAYQAYQKWVAENPKELPLPGVPLTHNQLFFLAYAQSECSVSTPENLRFAALADTHSASKYRVIGPVSNSEDFAREFKCRSKSAMNPQPKCEIW